MIVSSGENATSVIKEFVSEYDFESITCVSTCSAARQKLSHTEYDIIIVNSPLINETGENFAKTVAKTNKSQVILIFKSDNFDELALKFESQGIITVKKPVNKSLFCYSLKLAMISQRRIKIVQDEKEKLITKIEDIKVVDRAKHILISYLGMTETEAHKYIERKAMNSRTTRRETAEEILKIYDNER